MSEFKVTVRGAGGMIAHEYWCETHGRFEALVDRGASPDSIPCPMEIDCPECLGEQSMSCEICDAMGWTTCNVDSPWSPSSAPMCRVRKVEAIKGKSAKPERETWTTTDSIGEGQELYSWREDRAAVWERKRQRDVVAFAREHNERVRSDS